VAVRGEKPWPSAGTSRGRPWGIVVAVRGEFSWPPVGSSRWPLTAARELATSAGRVAAAAQCRTRLDELCARPVAHDANRRLLGHLANQADALFSFLTIEGVDATNFRGEQAVRPCVVNRKTWGGNRTWVGAATQGVLTSIIARAGKHGLDPVDYLVGRARSPDPGLAILLG